MIVHNYDEKLIETRLEIHRERLLRLVPQLLAERYAMHMRQNFGTFEDMCRELSELGKLTNTETILQPNVFLVEKKKEANNLEDLKEMVQEMVSAQQKPLIDSMEGIKKLLISSFQGDDTIQQWPKVRQSHDGMQERDQGFRQATGNPNNYQKSRPYGKKNSYGYNNKRGGQAYRYQRGSDYHHNRTQYRSQGMNGDNMHQDGGQMSQQNPNTMGYSQPYAYQNGTQQMHNNVQHQQQQIKYSQPYVQANDIQQVHNNMSSQQPVSMSNQASTSYSQPQHHMITDARNHPQTQSQVQQVYYAQQPKN